MIVTYHCDTCKNTFQRTLKKTEPKVSCRCGSEASRVFKNIDIDMEDSTVSTAIRTMMFSQLPSGRDKVVI